MTKKEQEKLYLEIRDRNAAGNIIDDYFQYGRRDQYEAFKEQVLQEVSDRVLYEKWYEEQLENVEELEKRCRDSQDEIEELLDEIEWSSKAEVIEKLEKIAHDLCPETAKKRKK